MTQWDLLGEIMLSKECWLIWEKCSSLVEWMDRTWVGLGLQERERFLRILVILYMQTKEIHPGGVILGPTIQRNVKASGNRYIGLRGVERTTKGSLERFPRASSPMYTIFTCLALHLHPCPITYTPLPGLLFFLSNPRKNNLSGNRLQLPCVHFYL